MITGCASDREVAQKVKAYLQAGGKADAIFGRNDKLACIAMQAAKIWDTRCRRKLRWWGSTIPPWGSM